MTILDIGIKVVGSLIVICYFEICVPEIKYVKNKIIALLNPRLKRICLFSCLLFNLNTLLPITIVVAFYLTDAIVLLNGLIRHTHFSGMF